MRQKTYLTPEQQWNRTVTLTMGAKFEEFLNCGGDYEGLQRSWYLGRIVQPHSLFRVGDFVAIKMSNGMAERQPVWGVSSKGHVVAGMYLNYQNFRMMASSAAAFIGGCFAIQRRRRHGYRVRFERNADAHSQGDVLTKVRGAFSRYRNIWLVCSPMLRHFDSTSSPSRVRDAARRINANSPVVLFIAKAAPASYDSLMSRGGWHLSDARAEAPSRSGKSG
jgi:hypothetical protein